MRTRAVPPILACSLVALIGLGGSPALAWQPECPAGNLLAGLRPVAAPQVSADDAARVTDGRIGPEGAAWDVPPALVLDNPEAVLTWDLGAEREVQGLLLQGDANERFPLSGSLDGRRFAPLGEIQALTDATGLRTRTLILPNPVRIRFLRLEPPVGDGFFSVAEVALFCELPRPWPPVLPVEPVSLPGPDLFSWNDLSSRWWELLLALLGLALLAVDAWREKREGEAPPGSWRRRLFGAAAVVSVLTFFNFGTFHFGNFLHNWDTLHYYIGAKYFRELSYDRLYECIAVADSLEPRLAQRVAHRKITNLRTNVLEGTEEILAHPERCTSHFTLERWQTFTADVAWFRDREDPLRWEETSTDHGFNATPVWMVAGSTLANLPPGRPASDRQILALTLIDPVYFAALLAVIGWAFGLRALAVALLVLATFFPIRFFWTGGSFLRWDWLFCMAASVACLKKGRPWLGGMALGYAALLRIFPGLLAAGPAAAVVSLVLRDGLRAGLRRPEVKTHLRFLGGAALATALLVPVSLAVTGGPETWRAFIVNTNKHKSTPLTNYMGLQTVVTWRPAEIGRRLVDATDSDPWQRWKEARREAWRQVRPLAILLAAAALVLLGRAARRHPEPWIAAALGALWIGFAVELTAYYYLFLIVPAFLWVEKRSVGIALLALAAFSHLVSLPLPNMPEWRDEQFTLISLATILVFGWILVEFGGRERAGTRPAPTD